MKTFIATLIMALGLVSFTNTASAENRVVANYSFGANDFPDAWGLSGEYDFVQVSKGSNLYAGLAVTDSTGGGDFSGAVYRGTVGVQWDVGANYLIKTAYSYDLVDGSQDNTQSFNLAGVYQGDAWRFQVGLTKPSGVDLLYGASAERKVLEQFAVGVGSVFNGDQYVSTALYGAYTF